MREDLVVLQRPQTAAEELRVQVGFWTRRNMQVPTYAGRPGRLIGARTGESTVPVFRLLGWGATEAQAMASAARNPLAWEKCAVLPVEPAEPGPVAQGALHWIPAEVSQ